MENPHLKPESNVLGDERFGRNLNVPWFPVVNDLIGGWAVSHIDKPLSEHDTRNGEGDIADFCTEEAARHVAEVHNAWLEAQALPPVIAMVEHDDLFSWSCRDQWGNRHYSDSTYFDGHRFHVRCRPMTYIGKVTP